jgi:hypothetical protein
MSTTFNIREEAAWMPSRNSFEDFLERLLSLGPHLPDYIIERIHEALEGFPYITIRDVDKAIFNTILDESQRYFNELIEACRGVVKDRNYFATAIDISELAAILRIDARSTSNTSELICHFQWGSKVSLKTSGWIYDLILEQLACASLYVNPESIALSRKLLSRRTAIGHIQLDLTDFTIEEVQTIKEGLKELYQRQVVHQLLMSNSRAVQEDYIGQLKQICAKWEAQNDEKSAS